MDMPIYRPQAPNGYKELKDLGLSVHSTIVHRGVPRPDHIAKVLGEQAVSAYFLMHALLHNLEYGRQRGLLDFARRDRKAIQRHTYDAAFKPLFRLKDKNLPSGYLLTDRMIIGILVHDLPEEFGGDPLGALVTNDYLHRVFGDKIHKDPILLTNNNALVSDSLKDKIEGLPEINHGNVSEIFNRGLERLDIKPEYVMHRYLRILHALDSFKTYVAHYKFEGDGDNSQRRAAIKILDHLKTFVPRNSTTIMDPEIVRANIREQYEHAIGVMEQAEEDGYQGLDQRLILPGEPEFYFTLKQTFYGDFIERIMQSAREDASLALTHLERVPVDDAYLSCPLEKVAEATDTTSVMDFALPNARSIFTKDMTQMGLGIDLIKYFGAQERPLDSQRFQRALYFLFRNLGMRVESIHESYLRSSRQDTTWELEESAFSYMREQVETLETRVSSFKPPTLVQRGVDSLRRTAGGVNLREVASSWLP